MKLYRKLNICTLVLIEFCLNLTFNAQVYFKNNIEGSIVDTIDLLDVDNHLRAIRVSIGYPPQKFVLLFDTTSEYTWVRGSNCLYCSFSKNFHEKESETLTMTNSTLTINNLNQNIKGNIAYDYVNVKIFSANNLAFLIVDEDYYLDGVDGVLGFGYGGSSEINFSFLDKLYQNKQIVQRIFSIRFNEEIVTNITIGKIPDHITQDFKNYTFCNINTTLHTWNCKVSHLFFGENLNFYKAKPLGVSAMFASTINNIQVPAEFVNFFLDYYFHLYPEYDSSFCHVKPDGKKNFILCNNKNFNINQAPSLNFIINGYSYRIPPEDLFEVLFSDAYSQYVLFKVIFTETEEKSWVLGNNFLKQYEMVFDKENDQIGFYSGLKYDFRKFTSDPTETFCFYNYFAYIFIIFIVGASMGYMIYKHKKEHKIATQLYINNNIINLQNIPFIFNGKGETFH